MFTITELICLVLAANTWPAVESAIGDDIKKEVFSEWSKYTHICTLYIRIHTMHIHTYTYPLHTHCRHTTYILYTQCRKLSMLTVTISLSTAKLCEVECTKLKCVGSEPL